MVDRRAIRDAVQTELGTVAGDYTVTYGDGSTDTITLAADDIKLLDPETPESLPQLVYDVSWNREYFNDAGTGPDMTNRDSDGNVIDERWREYIRASYLFYVRASTELHKEPIYESLRRQFGKYQFGYTSWKSVHDDIIRIEVLSSDRADTGDVEDRIRGEVLSVEITFYREYVFDETNIDIVNQEVDADLDSATTGLTYTTS